MIATSPRACPWAQLQGTNSANLNFQGVCYSIHGIVCLPAVLHTLDRCHIATADCRRLPFPTASRRRPSSARPLSLPLFLQPSSKFRNVA